MSISPKGFRRRLLDVRRQKDLTQAALAKEVGVDTMVVSRWERGLRLPSLKSWIRLKKLFPKVFRGPKPLRVSMASMLEASTES